MKKKKLLTVSSCLAAGAVMGIILNSNIYAEELASDDVIVEEEMNAADDTFVQEIFTEEESQDPCSESPELLSPALSKEDQQSVISTETDNLNTLTPAPQALSSSNQEIIDAEKNYLAAAEELASIESSKSELESSLGLVNYLLEFKTDLSEEEQKDLETAKLMLLAAVDETIADWGILDDDRGVYVNAYGTIIGDGTGSEKTVNLENDWDAAKLNNVKASFDAYRQMLIKLEADSYRSIVEKTVLEKVVTSYYFCLDCDFETEHDTDDDYQLFINHISTAHPDSDYYITPIRNAVDYIPRDITAEDIAALKNNDVAYTNFTTMVGAQIDTNRDYYFRYHNPSWGNIADILNSSAEVAAFTSFPAYAINMFYSERNYVTNALSILGYDTVHPTYAQLDEAVDYAEQYLGVVGHYTFFLFQRETERMGFGTGSLTVGHKIDPSWSGINAMYTFEEMEALVDEYQTYLSDLYASAQKKVDEARKAYEIALYGIPNGWNKQDDGTWVYSQKGVLSRGWSYIDKVWYYMDPATGIMETGWIYDESSWYYLNSNGAMQTGWLKDGKNWYYLNATGAMHTGWLKDGTSWYYLSSSGAMRTGWLNQAGTWYYLNATGTMHTGWLKDGANWYYLNSSGAMQTGWLKDGKNWYYLNSNGVMHTGWLYDKAWYYLNPDGVMKTGWIYDNGTRYYLNSAGQWTGITA